MEELLSDSCWAALPASHCNQCSHCIYTVSSIVSSVHSVDIYTVSSRARDPSSGPDTCNSVHGTDDNGWEARAAHESEVVSVFFFLNARPALGAGETVATLATSHTVLPSLGGDISDIHYQVSQQRGPGTL